MQSASVAINRRFAFVGGEHGPWRIEKCHGVIGESLPIATRMLVLGTSETATVVRFSWVLDGVTSNERYVERQEKVALVSRQEGLGRPASTCAALIPIRKTPAWWALPQDERRHVFEAQSRHIAIGLQYLPGVARRLHHCRDLGTEQPFDFLTWFEYAPSKISAFEELVAALRNSPEWEYVDREVDIRLVREGV